jgi:hypothetical protein
MNIRTAHLLGIGVILAISGLVHGMWTNRWTSGPDVMGKDLLIGIDGLVGSWIPGDMLTINPGDVPPKTKLISRQFTSVKNGSPIIVSVCSGYAGEVAVHTPDVCYLGAGYKLKSALTRQTIQLQDGKEASFWMADFEKTTATSVENVRVRWSWSKDGNWQAPDYPRLTFARAPVLYKLYIVHNLTEEEDLTRDDPYRKFAADLVPVLNRQLAP